MNNSIENLHLLQTDAGYRNHFVDVEFWAPVVREACSGMGIPVTRLRGGTPGTYPTFIIDEQYVIKFFGKLFNGSQSFAVEQAANRLITSLPEIPAPAVLSSGRLPGLSWQYLLYTFAPGASLGEVYSDLPYHDRQTTASLMGKIIRSLHALPIPACQSGLFPTDPAAYQAKNAVWFQTRLHTTDSTTPHNLGLPVHLANQAEDFLKEVGYSTPLNLHLIHADLTRDHILGQYTGGRWNITALIDFGDCRVGDFHDELAALYLDGFCCDQDMLRTFLQAYDLDKVKMEDFPERCLAAALRHPFNVFAGLFERRPELSGEHNLYQFARTIWGV